jgi:hypothetical protein
MTAQRRGFPTFVPSDDDSPGYLLWVADQALQARRFNADSLAFEGAPVSVAEGIAISPLPIARAAFWASKTGLLVYAPAAAAPESRRRP